MEDICLFWSVKTKRGKGLYSNEGTLAILLAAVFCLSGISNALASLTIHLNFLPGNAPTNMVGGGNVEDIVNVAAKSWERAFVDNERYLGRLLGRGMGAVGHLIGLFELLHSGRDASPRGKRIGHV